MKLAKEVGLVAAIILQHFYYLLVEGFGANINGERWLYNPRWEWVQEHFSSLSEWQYRKGINQLRQLGLLKTCQPKACEWDHTNYYTLIYETLEPLILSIGEPPPIDWRASTNRLVTAHQSIKESELTPKFTSSSTQSAASLPTAFPPQGSETSIGGTQCKGDASASSLRANPCIEPPPLCRSMSSHGGGMLTPPPTATTSVIDQQPDSDCFDDDSSVAALAVEAAADSNQPPYSAVQLEALKRVGVLLNSAMMSQLSRVTSKQIDDAIACFEEDRQSWSKSQPMTNPAGFFTKVLKQIKEGKRSPLPKSNPLEEALAMWRDRWFNPVLVPARKNMLREIVAAFPDGEITVVDWNEGPVLGST